MNQKRIIVALIFFLCMIGECSAKSNHVTSRNDNIKKTVSNSGKDQSTIGKLGRLNGRVMKINASAYSLSKRETDGNPHKTATNNRPIPGKTCAVSRDLKHLIDKKIYLVNEDRVLLVNDVMNKRYRKSIDIVWSSRKGALDFGRKDVIIVVLN